MTTNPTRLLQRLATDADRAFPDLVRTHQNGIYSGVLQFTRDPHDAEDVTQDTFVRAYRALSSYDTDRILDLQLRPWLWTIALNLCRNRARTRSRHPEHHPIVEHADVSSDPAVEAAASADLTLWRARLENLAGPQRTAVVLHHVVGLPYEELSETTGRSTSTCRSDVRRGLARLRTIIEEEER
jgi:RNA polymerase sigma-70 factor (ECF subfamily)